MEDTRGRITRHSGRSTRLTLLRNNGVGLDNLNASHLHMCDVHAPPAAYRAQGWLNMKNGIAQVLVIGVLLHYQAYISFHNLYGSVCYEAPYVTITLQKTEQTSSN